MLRRGRRRFTFAAAYLAEAGETSPTHPRFPSRLAAEWRRASFTRARRRRALDARGVHATGVVTIRHGAGYHLEYEIRTTSTACIREASAAQL